MRIGAVAFLFAVLGAAAQAQTVKIDFDSSVDIPKVAVVFSYHAGSAMYGGHYVYGSEVSKGPTSFSFDATSPYPQFKLATDLPYLVLGVLGQDEAGNKHVIASFSAGGAANAEGKSFEDVFGLSESYVYDAIANPSLNYELNSLAFDARGQYASFDSGPVPAGQLLAFSDGVRAGTVQAHVQSVPEPGFLLALGTGVLALGRRARRAA